MSGVWVEMITQTAKSYVPQILSLAAAVQTDCSGVLGFWDKETIESPRDLMKTLTCVKYVNALEEKARGREQHLPVLHLKLVGLSRILTWAQPISPG